MKRKIWMYLALILAGSMILFCFAGCQKPEKRNSESLSVAFVTESESIDDGSYNAGIWSGAEQFSKSRELPCAHYSAEHFSSEERSGGAAGRSAEEPAYCRS